MKDFFCVLEIQSRLAISKEQYDLLIDKMSNDDFNIDAKCIIGKMHSISCDFSRDINVIHIETDIKNFELNK